MFISINHVKYNKENNKKKLASLMLFYTVFLCNAVTFNVIAT